MTDRGWLENATTLTESGRSAREEVESRTEIAALEGWRRVGREDAERLVVLLGPLCAAVLDSGLLPDGLDDSLRRIIDS